MIHMWHPDIPHTREKPVERPLAQFLAVWRAKGWVVDDMEEEE